LTIGSYYMALSMHNSSTYFFLKKTFPPTKFMQSTRIPRLSFVRISFCQFSYVYLVEFLSKKNIQWFCVSWWFFLDKHSREYQSFDLYPNRIIWIIDGYPFRW